MIYLLIAYSIIVTILAKYFYDQWKENEALYELRKIDYPVLTVVNSRDFPDGMAVTIESANVPKLNKDGSIAKKRGRKSNVKAV